MRSIYVRGGPLLPPAPILSTTVGLPVFLHHVTVSFPSTLLMSLTGTLVHLMQKRQHLPDTKAADGGSGRGRASPGGPAAPPNGPHQRAQGEPPPREPDQPTQDRNQGHHPQDRPANQERHHPGARGPQQRAAQDPGAGPAPQGIDQPQRPQQPQTQRNPHQGHQRADGQDGQAEEDQQPPSRSPDRPGCDPPPGSSPRP